MERCGVVTRVRTQRPRRGAWRQGAEIRMDDAHRRAVASCRLQRGRRVRGHHGKLRARVVPGETLRITRSVARNITTRTTWTPSQMQASNCPLKRHPIVAGKPASNSSRAARLSGLTICEVNPASCDLRLSSSCPHPDWAMMTMFCRPPCPKTFASRHGEIDPQPTSTHLNRTR